MRERRSPERVANLERAHQAAQAALLTLDWRLRAPGRPLDRYLRLGTDRRVHSLPRCAPAAVLLPVQVLGTTHRRLTRRLCARCSKYLAWNVSEGADRYTDLQGLLGEEGAFAQLQDTRGWVRVAALNEVQRALTQVPMERYPELALWRETSLRRLAREATVLTTGLRGEQRRRRTPRELVVLEEERGRERALVRAAALLAHPVLHQGGGRVVLLAPPALAEALGGSSAPERGDPPEVLETAAALWEPGGRGPLGELDGALEAARALCEVRPAEQPPGQQRER